MEGSYVFQCEYCAEIFETSLDTELNDTDVDATFPICVDVYEEGDTIESADGHRHGWFGKDGQPVDVKGGVLEPGRGAGSRKGYYPAFGGEVQRGNSFSPPPTYQKP